MDCYGLLFRLGSSLGCSNPEPNRRGANAGRGADAVRWSRSFVIPRINWNRYSPFYSRTYKFLNSVLKGGRSRSGSRVGNSQSGKSPAGRDSARRSTKNVWSQGRASSRNIWADTGNTEKVDTTTHDEDGNLMARNSMAPNDGYESNKMPEYRQVIQLFSTVVLNCLI